MLSWVLKVHNVVSFSGREDWATPVCRALPRKTGQSRGAFAFTTWPTPLAGWSAACAAVALAMPSLVWNVNNSVSFAVNSKPRTKVNASNSR